MSRIIASLLLVFAASLAVAAAQDRPAAGPSSQQLLKAQVGGTHIPQQAEPQPLANPYAKDGKAIEEGHKLFDAMNCSGCHAAEGGGGMGPPLSDNQWIYGSRPEQIYLTIVQGRPNGMPAFGSILPDDSVWKLIAYIKTLSPTAAATPALKNPPVGNKE